MAYDLNKIIAPHATKPSMKPTEHLYNLLKSKDTIISSKQLHRNLEIVLLWKIPHEKDPFKLGWKAGLEAMLYKFIVPEAKEIA